MADLELSTSTLKAEKAGQWMIACPFPCEQSTIYFSILQNRTVKLKIDRVSKL